MRKALFFLGTLNDTDIDWMASKGDRVAVPAGRQLIQEGEPISELFIVIDGTFSVTVGKAGHELARLHSGEILGEVSFVDSRPPSATVTATENSIVLAVSRSLLQARLDEDLLFAARFYRALSVFLADRLRTTTVQLSNGSQTESDEIDLETLENLSLAGARFEWLLSTLRGK
jgi:CRP-like cAMP-binding protein